MTKEELHKLLTYSPDTGKFYWIKRNQKEAGSIQNKGYITIRVNNKQYLAHRLAFLYMLGSLPKMFVDHKNSNRQDNSWTNLREVDRKTNNEHRIFPSKTNRTGFLGVTKFYNKYIATIRHFGKKIVVGRFNTPEEAHLAYLETKRKIHKGNTL